MRPFLVVICCALLLGGCGNVRGVADCDDDPLPASAMPEPAGFSVVETREVEAEGCGASMQLQGVLSTDAADALESFATAMEEDGWTPATCITKQERCFESDEFFVAATTLGGARAGYPRPVGDGPQVLVSVSRTPSG